MHNRIRSRRLCADCSLPKPTPAQSQHSWLVRLYGRRPAAKTQRNTCIHSTVACSMSPRRQLSHWTLLSVCVASDADVGGQQIVTQHTAQLWAAACWTDGYFEQRRHWTFPLPTLTIVPTLDSWVDNGAAFCSKPRGTCADHNFAWRLSRFQQVRLKHESFPSLDCQDCRKQRIT